MNALGSRHLGRNLRILLVNNGRGVLFRKPGNMGSLFGEEADNYICAAGHYGNMSANLVKDYALNLGFDYLSATNKEELKKNAKLFLSPEITEKPILFEAFTTVDDEIKGDYMVPSSGLKEKMRSFFGDDLYTTFSSLIHRKGTMTIDTGNNKQK